MADKICPMVCILETLSKKWTLLILRDLNSGDKKRFSEINKELSNINPRILSLRLKELEKAELLSRQRFNEIPPRVEYELTQKGKELLKCFRYLDNWVVKWKLNQFTVAAMLKSQKIGKACLPIQLPLLQRLL